MSVVEELVIGYTKRMISQLELFKPFGEAEWTSGMGSWGPEGNTPATRQSLYQ